jgi:hypothetical protein
MLVYFMSLVFQSKTFSDQSFHLDLFKKQNPLDDDAYLNPVDCITPYTLKRESGYMLNQYIHYHSLVGHSMASQID